DGRALLTQGTEGEVYANPQRFPQTHLIVAGEQEILADKQEYTSVDVPASKEVAVTVTFIEECLNGERAIPAAILTQLACVLVATGVCADMAEAKMIVDQVY